MPAAELEKEVSIEKASNSLLEIAVNRDALLSELSIAANIVETKSTIPILANFLFVADENGVTITATDLDRSIVTPVPAKVKKPGSVCIPARKLYDYVKLLASGSEITLKTLENNWVQIRSGRSNTKMVGMARASYPQVPAIGSLPSIKLPVHTLKLLMAQTSFAISREETRYTLNGALFGVAPDKQFMVATDGHRLAISEMNANLNDVKEKFTILLPSRAIDDVNIMMSATEATDVSFAHDDRNIYFLVAHRQYAIRRLVGNFPNYAAVIPRENNNSFIVGVAAVELAVKRVATFADERSGAVTLSIADNALTFSAKSSESGESEEPVETTYGKDKPAISIRFNSTYILDVLKAVGGKGEIKFKLKDGQSACTIEPEGEGQETKFLTVVMPMR